MIFVYILLALFVPPVGVPLLIYNMWKNYKSAEKKLDSFKAEQDRRYEGLPELGKARIDKGAAKTGFVVSIFQAVGLTSLAALINPVGAVFVGGASVRYISNKWEERNASIKSADERRAKALSA